MGRVTIDGDEWDMGKEARYGIDIGYDEDDEEEMMEWDNEFMEVGGVRHRKHHIRFG